MGKKIIALLWFAGLISISLAFAQPNSSLQKSTLQIDHTERAFYYHMPMGLKKNAKLIFVIHGSTATPAVMQTSTGYVFDKLADENKDAIIVYPAGYGKYWNDCRKAGTYETKKMNIDDVGFFGKMIGFFKQNYDIDTTEVFAVGHSNGGQMCYKLAKEKPLWFKGIAAISASLPVAENDDCYDLHLPISVLVINGTGDPINPYNGGEVIAGDGQKRGAVISTDATIRTWITTNHCDTIATINQFADINITDHSTAISYLYKGNNKKVELVKIINGGHVIPTGSFNQWPKQLGIVNKDIDAPKIIWDFFYAL